MISNTFITNNNLEIYINTTNNFATVKPLNSKRDPLVIDNFSDKLVLDTNDTLAAFSELFEDLKEQAFQLIINQFDEKQTVINEQLETIKKLHNDLNDLCKEIILYKKY